MVSTDRGLCGGLNNNLFRRLLADMPPGQDKGVEVDIVAVGSKANAFFRRLKVNLVGSATHLGENPQVTQLIGVTGDARRLQRRPHRPAEARLQRLRQHHDAEGDHRHPAAAAAVGVADPRTTGTTCTSLNPETVLDHVLTRYIESLVYQSTLENLASEHARAWWR